MEIFRFTAALALSALPLVAPAAGNDDGCSDVLKYSSQDTSIERAEIGAAVRIYDEYCESSELKKSASIDAKADLLIKSVPVKFGGRQGSTIERLTQFCKIFSSDYERNESYYKATSKAVAGTTNAWLACKGLAANGVVIRPRLSKSVVLLEVERLTAKPVRVMGITYAESAATCTVPDSDTGNRALKASANTRRDLSSGIWTVTCVRTPQTVRGEEVFPEVDIAIATDAGGFILPLARDARYPYVWASDLQRELASVRTIAEGAQAGLDQLHMESGTVVLDKDDGGMTGVDVCPDPQRYRGKVAARVNFKKEFSSPPIVSLSLNSIDFPQSDDSYRARAELVSVDTKGFTYNLVTWCRTKLFGAQANWVAISK